MNRPVSFKMDKDVHNAAIALLESDKLKYRSFTAIVERAIVEFVKNEKEKDSLLSGQHRKAAVKSNEGEQGVNRPD